MMMLMAMLMMLIMIMILPLLHDLLDDILDDLLDNLEVVGVGGGGLVKLDPNHRLHRLLHLPLLFHHTHVLLPLLLLLPPPSQNFLPALPD